MDENPENDQEPDKQVPANNPVKPGGRMRLAGLAIGFLYCAVVVWLSDIVVASLSQGHGDWMIDMAPGLSLPMVPQFGIGLTAGLVILLLVVFLLRRSQRNLSIGLLPGAAALFLLLASFLISVPKSGFARPMPMGGPMKLTPQIEATGKKISLLEMAARAARARGDWATAAADYRAETRVPRVPFPNETWVSLGLMLDRQGKTEEAYTAYQNGFSPTHNGVGDAGTAGPENAEAVAHFGLMCEDRGRHADACDAYYAARHMDQSEIGKFLEDHLNPKTTSPTLARSRLDIALGLAREDQSFKAVPAGTAAFRQAVKLQPNDPLPWYFLACGLRRDGQLAASRAALQKVIRLDKDGHLKAQVASYRYDIRRDW